VNPEEAINLSLRSLELDPDQPAYLDTLARCYFSAGNVEKAVLVQKRAVRLAPHERQMAAQLREFESALEAKHVPIEGNPQ
jgi:cytochrome c-type biogenesis protein CcmH/NrfG